MSTGGPDFTQIPVSSEDWDAFLEWAPQGVHDESDFIEFKDSDPSTREGSSKAAKFILGAANRHPDAAAEHLAGHALLFMGVRADGVATGCASVDLVKIQKLINAIVGTNPGPRWTHHRIGVDGDREVFVVVVRPPRRGDQLWFARKSSGDVVEGRVYIRVGGETREANSAEMQMLRDREAAATVEELPRLEVSLETPVFSLQALDEAAIDDYVARVRRRMLGDLPSEKARVRKEREEARARLSASPRSSPWNVSGIEHLGAALGPMAKVQSAADQLSAKSVVFQGISAIGRENRSESTFREQVEEYCASLSEWIQNAYESGYAAGEMLSPFQVRVHNATDAIVKRLAVTIHVEGPIEVVAPVRQSGPPSAPRAWGEGVYPVVPTGLAQRAGFLSGLSSVERYMPAGGGPTATGHTTGSVKLDIDDLNLRSRETTIVEGNVGLLVVDPGATRLTATWEGRAENVPALLTGDFSIDVGKPFNMTELLIAYVDGEKSLR